MRDVLDCILTKSLHCLVASKDKESCWLFGSAVTRPGKMGNNEHQPSNSDGDAQQCCRRHGFNSPAILHSHSQPEGLYDDSEYLVC